MTQRAQIFLALNAGARAIEQSMRLIGKYYLYDVMGNDEKRISYFEAAQILRMMANDALPEHVREDHFRSSDDV